MTLNIIFSAILHNIKLWGPINVHIVLISSSIFLLNCGTNLNNACVENVEVRRNFVEIDYCQFTWIVFTPYLYLLNPKLKKLLAGRMKAIFHEFCNHWGERTRKLLMAREGCMTTIASWLLFGNSFFKPLS